MTDEDNVPQSILHEKIQNIVEAHIDRSCASIFTIDELLLRYLWIMIAISLISKSRWNKSQKPLQIMTSTFDWRNNLGCNLGMVWLS